MRKVIFLDIDGVLNPKWWERKMPIDRYGCAFDSIAVSNLEKIIAETEADIVISSSWKCMGLSELQNMWKERILPGKIIGVTPDLMSDEVLIKVSINNEEMTCNRGCEIKAWLAIHGDDISHYVILDDMDDILDEQENHFVWIDPEVGITVGNVVQATMILKHLPYGKENTRYT